jgi:hypothetical protein
MRTKFYFWLGYLLLLSIRLGVKYLKIIEPFNYHYQRELNGHGFSVQSRKNDKIKVI